MRSYYFNNSANFVKILVTNYGIHFEF